MFTIMSAVQSMGRKMVDALFANLSDVDVSSAFVGYAMRVAGGVETREGGAFGSIGTWLLDGDAADFEVNLQLNSGDTPTGDQVSTWLPMTQDRIWNLARDTAGDNTFSGTIRIRRANNQVVLDTASVSMYVEVGN